jgi:hypothetical protein
MDIINKKRDQKAREKKQFSNKQKGVVKEKDAGEKTVDFFKTGDDKKKSSKHVGDKRKSKKFVGVKYDEDKVKKTASPYVHKSGKP